MTSMRCRCVDEARTCGSVLASHSPAFWINLRKLWKPPDSSEEEEEEEGARRGDRGSDQQPEDDLTLSYFR
ncbi:hypothetical protein Q5P01_024558 [Channa striata]|uniref:Uncharacterized protein n=1 Tax=Channa striata TaxID=64152 RepID=A0AA88LN26_CHASR|nr:hypothetical protein Q5P01_024558 [Channa striata]